jgi:hypothetical protein
LEIESIPKATQDNLEEYVATKIYLHNYENVTDYNLWTVFKEEFKNFTTNNFKQLRVVTRTRLRAHLLRGGVYVKRHNTNAISQMLCSLFFKKKNNTSGQTTSWQTHLLNLS